MNKYKWFGAHLTDHFLVGIKMSRRSFYNYSLATVAFVVLFGLSYFLRYSSRYRQVTQISDSRVFSEFTSQTELATAFPQKINRAEENSVVIFNVMPKSGSRTLYELVMRLNETKNITIRNTMGGSEQSHSDKMREIRSAIYSKNMGFLYSHMRYRPFGSEHKRPKYISIIRDPVDRLASLYYFIRYGDNIEDQNKPGLEFREKMKTMNYSDESFNECVLNGGKSCRDSRGFIRHFCGNSKALCNKASTTTAYRRAIYNVNNQYLLVGIMEDYLSVLKALEILIPDIFSGVTQIYLDQRKGIVGKMKTRNKTIVSNFVRNKLKAEMKDDYKFYNYVKEKFDILKLQLNISEV